MLFNLSKKYFNDLQISIAFTVLFTAYNTQTHIQKTLTVSIQQDDPDYHTDGYVCFGVLYTCFALGMCLAPSFQALVGLKSAMVFGALGYIPLLTFSYFEIGWLTYVGSGISGFAAAFLWTGQATYIILNSKIGSVYHSIGIFWIFYQASYFTGNSFVYYLFKDPHQLIDKPLRQKITLILGGFVLSSVVIFCTLGHPIRFRETEKIRKTAKSELKAAFCVFKNKNMLTSVFVFIFCGLNLEFFSVIAASLGFTKYLSSNSKELAPLSGVSQGVGEIVGCIFAAFMNGKSILKLRIIHVACILSFVAYIITFLGLPDISAFNYTDEKPFVELSVYYFLLANVFIGTADACIHIEIYNYLGCLYPNNSAPAFAVFKFVRCLSLATGFYYSSYLGLHIQALILMTFSLLAFISYSSSMNKSHSSAVAIVDRTGKISQEKAITEPA